MSLASNNAKGKGANIALFVIFGLAGVIGITLHDNYADLVIWSIWALLNALIALIAAIVKKKVDPVIVAGDKEKNFAEQTANKVSTELIEVPVVHCSVNFNDPELEAPMKSIKVRWCSYVNINRQKSFFKFVSNPYVRSIFFMIFDSTKNDWVSLEIQNHDSKLRQENIDKVFLPFKAMEIVNIIIEEYYTGTEKVEIVFQGTTD